MRYDDLKKLQNNMKGHVVCIFGAGLIGSTWAYDLLKAAGFHINFYCDNNKEENLEIRDGVKTVSLENLYSVKDNVLVFITILDEEHHNSVKRQLEEKGIYNIIKVDYCFLHTFMGSLIEKNDPRINDQFKCILDDKEYICRQFKYRFGYDLNLENPKTYNEKINWEKLYNRDERKTKLADKFLVRNWVREQVGEEHLTKIYGVWDDADEIDFTMLPSAFALKTNNGSGRNIIVKDKTQIDQREVCKQLNEWKNKNYTDYREFQYKDIVPKIICEEYLDGVAESVYDYNIFCFHGEPIYIWCIKGSHKKNCQASFYNKNWEMQPFSYGYPKDNVLAPRPEKLEEMLELSRILSKDFQHVRVDWYNLPDGRVLFGEITFSTWAGFQHFEPEEYDLIFGNMI